MEKTELKLTLVDERKKLAEENELNDGVYGLTVFTVAPSEVSWAHAVVALLLTRAAVHTRRGVTEPCNVQNNMIQTHGRRVPVPGLYWTDAASIGPVQAR